MNSFLKKYTINYAKNQRWCESKKSLKKVLTIIKGIWYYKKALEREEKREKEKSARTLKIKQHKI